MLHAADHTADALVQLEQLRPLLAAEYGAEPVHVHSLDKRIASMERLR